MLLISTGSSFTDLRTSHLRTCGQQWQRHMYRSKQSRFLVGTKLKRTVRSMHFDHVHFCNQPYLSSSPCLSILITSPGLSKKSKKAGCSAGTNLLLTSSELFAFFGPAAAPAPDPAPHCLLEGDCGGLPALPHSAAVEGGFQRPDGGAAGPGGLWNPPEPLPWYPDP